MSFTERGMIRRGYAYKDRAGRWRSPYDGRIWSAARADSYNDSRRKALAVADSWRDLKQVSPETAKRIGWNRYQRVTWREVNRREVGKESIPEAIQVATVREARRVDSPLNRRELERWVELSEGTPEGLGRWGNSF